MDGLLCLMYLAGARFSRGICGPRAIERSYFELAFYLML